MNLEDKLSLIKTKSSMDSHIQIDQSICKNCSNKICLTICPAKTYEEFQGIIKVSHENCLECGSCRLACPKGAIDWKNPRGSYGVSFING